MQEKLLEIKELIEKKEFKKVEENFLELLKNNRDNFEAYYQFSLYLMRVGKLVEAIKVLEGALKLFPNNITVLNNLGVLYKKIGKIGVSEKLYKACIEKEKNYIEAYGNLGNLYRENGLYKDALDISKKAVEIAPENYNGWINLGLSYQKLQAFQNALDSFNKALKIKPNSAGCYFNIGNLLYDVKDYTRAEFCLKKAIELSPKRADYYNNLGVMLKQQKKYKEAVEFYKKGLILSENHGNTYNNMSLALKELREYDEALVSVEKAIKLNPKDANAYNNLGTILEDMLRFDEAKKAFEKAIEIKADHINANWNLAVLTLNLGNIKDGFQRYEWRWKSEGAKKKPVLESKEWQGEDINGKTILIYSEQGFGDSIHFARYFPMLKERGATIIYQCKKELLPLMKNLRSIDRVVESYEDVKSDFNCALLALPGIFQTDIDTIPNSVPYLYTRGRKVDFKADTKKLNIGFVWSGSPTHKKHDERLIDLKLFEPLFKLQNTKFFSLQVGDDSSQIKEYGLEKRVTDLSPKLKDFSKTASVISQLDLVIGSDTSVMHLAGALGIKGYLFIPRLNDWRWMRDREDSPWYPSLKLFRQKRYKQWEDVIERVKQEIIENMDVMLLERKKKRKSRK